LSAIQWLSETGGLPTQAAYGDVIEPGRRAQAGPVSHTGVGVTYSGNNPTTVYPCKTGIPKTVLPKTAAVKATEEEMASYICNTGVLSILVDASKWQTYVGGVMMPGSCGTDIDHAVLLVGISAKDNAWIVQNSWGPDFGVDAAGNEVPHNKYSNCDELAASAGCQAELTTGGTVGESCALACTPGATADGGYLLLSYGGNVCGITNQAVSVNGA
jgi:hypothetical protein